MLVHQAIYLEFLHRCTGRGGCSPSPGACPNSYFPQTVEQLKIAFRLSTSISDGFCFEFTTWVWNLSSVGPPALCSVVDTMKGPPGNAPGSESSVSTMESVLALLGHSIYQSLLQCFVNICWATGRTESGGVSVEGPPFNFSGLGHSSCYRFGTSALDAKRSLKLCAVGTFSFGLSWYSGYGVFWHLSSASALPLGEEKRHRPPPLPYFFSTQLLTQACVLKKLMEKNNRV